VLALYDFGNIRHSRANVAGFDHVAEIQGTHVPRPIFVENIVPLYVLRLLQVCCPYYIHLSAMGNTVAEVQACLRWVGPACPLASLHCPAFPFPRQGMYSGDTVCTSLSYQALSALPLVVLPDGLSAVADAIRDSNGEELREMAGGEFEETWRRSIVCGGGENSARRWKGI